MPFDLFSSIYIDSKFDSTFKTSPDMKKVNIALGIPTEYHKWCWLLSPVRLEKYGLLSREKIRRIKYKMFAREPIAGEGRIKRFSSLAQESSVEKKLKTPFATHDSPSTVGRFVIDLTSFKGKK